MGKPRQQVFIDYTNWRGVRAERRVTPIRIEFKSNVYHRDAQWIMDAVDVEKGELRSFAMKDVHSWRVAV